MLVEKIKSKAAHEEINVIIEIPMQSNPVKYEMDKESGAIFVDRFMQTAMFYPGNYGFIPHSLSGDGDPVDVLVMSHYPVVPGCVIRSRPIGVLMMEDESGLDEKIIAVPSSKLDITFDSIKDLDDLCPMLRQRIVHFFEHYKNLEKGKWVKVIGWENAQKAKELINEGISRVRIRKQ
jgi:inorganic pyrophosphatase